MRTPFQAEMLTVYLIRYLLWILVIFFLNKGGEAPLNYRKLSQII